MVLNMPILTAIIYTFIAGIINGSFALPTKTIKQWRFENIWLNYAFWGFLILPWAIILLLAPNVLSVYQATPLHLLWILVIGGAAFGIGQVCFAQSLKMIGLGLGFVINIGLGTGLGFLLPLVFLHPEKVFTPFGWVTMIGILFIIAGLIVSYQAGQARDRHKQNQQTTTEPSQYKLGVALAVIAGIFSACQNFTFAGTSAIQQLALNMGLSQLASAMIIWPVFLIFTFIPYAIYMLRLHQKNNSFANYHGKQSLINIPIALMMGLFWFFSLVLYSQASLLIGRAGPIVAWPLFMVLIILTSNFWGWRKQEWANTSAAIERMAVFAISLLVIAVIILAYAATLSS